MYRLTKQGSYILDKVVSSVNYSYESGKQFYMNIRSNCNIPVQYKIKGTTLRKYIRCVYPGKQKGIIPMEVMGNNGVTVSILTKNRNASIIVCMSRDHEHSNDSIPDYESD